MFDHPMVLQFVAEFSRADDSSAGQEIQSRLAQHSDVQKRKDRLGKCIATL